MLWEQKLQQLHDANMDAELASALFKAQILHCTECLLKRGVHRIADVHRQGEKGLVSLGLKKPEVLRIVRACSSHAAVLKEEHSGVATIPTQSQDCARRTAVIKHGQGPLPWLPVLQELC